MVHLCFVWEAVMVTYALTGLKSIYTAEIQTLTCTKVLEQTREMLIPTSKFLSMQTQSHSPERVCGCCAIRPREPAKSEKTPRKREKNVLNGPVNEWYHRIANSST
jgi:hypothetical protein